MKILAILAILTAIYVFSRLQHMRLGHPIVISSFLLFGTMQIVFDLPAFGYAIVSGEIDDPYPGVVLMSGFLAFMGFYAIGGGLSRECRRIRRRFTEEGLRQPYPEKYYAIGIGLTGALLILLGLYYYRGVPPIAEAANRLISGESDSYGIAGYMREMRYDLTKGYYFGEEYRGQGLIRIMMWMGWPYLLASCISNYAIAKRKLWVLLGAVTGILGLVFISGDGTRAPVLLGLLNIIVLLSFLRKISLSKSVIYGLLSLFLVLGLTIISHKGILFFEHQENPWAALLSRIAERVFVSNGMNSIHIVELIRSGALPQGLGELHVNKFSNALPGIHSNLPLAHELSMLLMYKTSTAYQTMTYSGFVYADFGIYGVLAIFSLLGVVLAKADKLIFDRPKVVTRLPVLAGTVFSLGTIPLYGPVGVISSLIVLVTIDYLFRMFAGGYHIFEQGTSKRFVGQGRERHFRVDSMG